MCTSKRYTYTNVEELKRERERKKKGKEEERRRGTKVEECASITPAHPIPENRHMTCWMASSWGLRFFSLSPMAGPCRPLIFPICGQTSSTGLPQKVGMIFGYLTRFFISFGFKHSFIPPENHTRIGLLPSEFRKKLFHRRLHR